MSQNAKKISLSIIGSTNTSKNTEVTPKSLIIVTAKSMMEAIIPQLDMNLGIRVVRANNI
jgi:hypothetical protein